MPKSESFTCPLEAKSRVARLDVAMDDAAIVGVAQGAADFDDDPHYFAPIETPAATQFFLQAVAVDQFHGVEQVRVLLAEAEQFDDVRMVEFAESFDFGLEAVAKTFLLGQSGGEQFDGGRFARLEIDAFVDRAHAAAAELCRRFDKVQGVRFAWKRSWVACHLPSYRAGARSASGRGRKGSGLQKDRFGEFKASAGLPGNEE